MDKDKEIMDYLEEKVFGPALIIDKPEINQLISYTKMIMNRMNVNAKITFVITSAHERPDVEKN